MVADTTACRAHASQEPCALDDAVTVWVVLEAAAAAPDTPEAHAEHAAVKKRFIELIEQLGLDEQMLRARLARRLAERQASRRSPARHVRLLEPWEESTSQRSDQDGAEIVSHLDRDEVGRR